MALSEKKVARIIKEAGFFDNVKSWFSGFFAPKTPGSKEQQRATLRADSHFKAKDKDWDRFVENAKRKSFAKAIAGDRRADSKLKMHVDNMNRLKTGKVLASVSGTPGSRTAARDGAQSYKIVKLRGSNRLGCTCRDWRFKKSVAAPGEQVDCKHIREFKQMNKTASRASRLTFITGGAGAGKSTMAEKLVDSGEFDVLIGTDTGGVVNGQYVKPPKAEREKIRNRREALALNMRAKGKRVLVEGYPRGVLRYPKLLAQADDVLYLDTPMATRMFRVGKRSRERGTPMLPDLKMALTTHFDDMKYRKEIEKKSPNFRSIRTYEDAKKEAGHVEDRIAERAPGATYEVAKIKAAIPMMNLRKGQTYHVPLKGGKGFVVIGDVGGKHVVKTVLGPHMRPPGERRKYG